MCQALGSSWFKILEILISCGLDRTDVAPPFGARIFTMVEHHPASGVLKKGCSLFFQFSSSPSSPSFEFSFHRVLLRILQLILRAWPESLGVVVPQHHLGPPWGVETSESSAQGGNYRENHLASADELERNGKLIS